MLNILQLTDEQFIRTATLEAIKHEAFDLFEHLMPPEGKKLADQIEQKLRTPGLEQRAPDIYRQYYDLMIKLKILSLLCQDNDAVYDLIKNHYTDAFDVGLDWNERMTGKMYSVPDLVWLEYSEQLISALKQNAQTIGQQVITIKGEAVPQRPAIQNWIRDYDQTYGPEKQTNIQQEEYLAKNSNAQTLNEEEKAKLRNVLQFYDNLKPIPASEIDKFFYGLALQEEKKIGTLSEVAPPFEAATPYKPPPPTPTPPPKILARPAPTKEEYLEPPVEERPPIPPVVPPASPAPPPPSPQPPTPPRPTPPPTPSYPGYETAQPSAPPPKDLPMQPTPPRPEATPAPKSPYLEPVPEPEPRTPKAPPARAEPRLDGNIVDLKNVDNRFDTNE